jgi:hypothetical protein
MMLTAVITAKRGLRFHSGTDNSTIFPPNKGMVRHWQKKK